MSLIRPFAAAGAALVAAVALAVGATHLLQPEHVDVSPVVLPADPQPGPVVPEPASTTSIGEAWSGGAPATATRATAVPAITCPEEDSCVQAYYPNEGNGYHMLRQANGTKWVRTTMVPGWDNSFVAPITCKWYSWCVYDYYGPGHYWMARQSDGTTWVKLSRNPAGAV